MAPVGAAIGAVSSFYKQRRARRRKFIARHADIITDINVAARYRTRRQMIMKRGGFMAGMHRSMMAQSMRLFVSMPTHEGISPHNGAFAVAALPSPTARRR